MAAGRLRTYSYKPDCDIRNRYNLDDALERDRKKGSLTGTSQKGSEALQAQKPRKPSSSEALQAQKPASLRARWPARCARSGAAVAAGTASLRSAGLA